MEGKSSQLWALIARFGRILLTSHQQADIDAIASVLTLQYLINHRFPDKNIRIFFNGMKGIASKFSTELIETGTQTLPSPGEIDLSILVDGNNFSRIGCDQYFETFSGARIIIDHHVPPETFPQNVQISFIDLNRPSCVEVLYDLLEKGEVLPLNLRRLMVAGMYSDSKNLTLCDSRSFHILAELLGNDLKLGDITQLLHEEATLSERIARLKGAQRADVKQIGSWIITSTNVSSFEAQVDNGLIALGADVAFVISKQKGGKCRIIGRASSILLKTGRFNFGELFQAIEGVEIESAGGHPGAAGISFTGDPDQVLKEILKRARSLLSEIPENSQE
jgi:nanoRNase/pAp phosphatase (c-di-AMP/oligoRNAs hydrolase)